MTKKEDDFFLESDKSISRTVRDDFVLYMERMVLAMNKHTLQLRDKYKEYFDITKEEPKTREDLNKQNKEIKRINNEYNKTLKEFLDYAEEHRTDFLFGSEQL